MVLALRSAHTLRSSVMTTSERGGALCGVPADRAQFRHDFGIMYSSYHPPRPPGAVRTSLVARSSIDPVSLSQRLLSSALLRLERRLVFRPHDI